MSMVVAVTQESRRNPLLVAVKPRRVVPGPCSRMSPLVVRGWVAPFFSPGLTLNGHRE